MCGIAGHFDFTAQSAPDRTIVKAMADAIAHRGPDGEGFHFEPGVAFAHRRLAIIDVAGGQQPLFNEDRSIALVYNGELYNYRELIPELKQAGHVFSTHSDTEVIVHAWEEWGADCVNRFRGMFAFAIHDAKRGCLFLARDRFGKKPLYYTVVGSRHFVFASELKALLAHPQVRREIDPLAVDEYLAFGYVPDPRSIYRGIHKLPAAHHLTVTRGQLIPAAKRYWRLSFGHREMTERDAVGELPARLTEAVRIRLMSEVPLGAFLSGGVDSSGVVALMSQEVGTPVKTFALGFGENGTDELSHALRVAERYGTAHHEEQVDVDPLGSYIAQAAIFDEPFSDSSSIPTYYVSRLARRDVTVALSGDGGDEVFAGYRRYRLFRETERLRRMLPGAVRGPAFGALGQLYPKLDWAPRWMRAKYTFHELALSSPLGYYRMVCRLQDAQRSFLYSPQMRRIAKEHDPSSIIVRAMEDANTDDPLARAQYADIVTYLTSNILTKVDRASMAVSLEVRVPMLDHEFVEWAAQIPSTLRLQRGEGKYVLKRALEPFVPRENLYRAKQGFTTSLASYFRGQGADFLRKRLLGETMADSGLWDMDAMSQFVRQHESGQFDHSQQLWTLLMFEGFLQVHARQDASAGALKSIGAIH